MLPIYPFFWIVLSTALFGQPSKLLKLISFSAEVGHSTMDQRLAVNLVLLKPTKILRRTGSKTPVLPITTLVATRDVIVIVKNAYTFL